MEPVIEMRDLTKRYGDQVAVDRVTLHVPPGEIFGFLGPNGAGKTTTILMLLGLSEPTSGWARICGLDPTRAPVKVKRISGYLPEAVGFYEDMTAIDNLRYVARLNGIQDSQARMRIAERLALVGLADEGKKRVGAYSRGMRQRLGIAEVLLKDPRVVFLDEPTVGLDPDGTQRMLEMIQSLSRERGITVFFSSHLLDQVQRISARVGIMLKGRLVAVGSIQELGQQSLGVGQERYTLEEVYMRYFRQGPMAAA
ncbi:MAG TPA: ABC transporter ATP-binding protein [Candidatus Rokubacteria bacterium]|nr:MAG: multidrug ABC transporter ATP-binding protein [Candidatus Rokubacteria bacterium GWA2_70_23]OGK91058.1 MAG: multidrug ABC transporter ATP-binding protein [Candidatus Rokubacteria bacterium GWF2_70_14]OGL13575.1 MAG: multidrug ABC transporter ATP-binding protein [Candidatus Rokubacteria bacterium RIFCSPLOWO2_12_FULL_71_19]HAM55003.1 ABC transporter ATP-binding protein [Candidatus Rokubacteria bacterium]